MMPPTGSALCLADGHLSPKALSVVHVVHKGAAEMT
jgi:hypothetical protein